MRPVPTRKTDLSDDEARLVLQELERLLALHKTKRQVGKALGLDDHNGQQLVSAAMLKRPSDRVTEALLAHLKMSRNEFFHRGTSLAVPHFISDGVHPVIIAVAKALGFSDREALVATSLVRALGGTGDMTEEQAKGLLENARGSLKNAGQVFGGRVVADSGGSALDDLSGGARPKLPMKRR